jgi:hypothetical protein
MVPWLCPRADLAVARAVSCNHIVLCCIDDALGGERDFMRQGGEQHHRRVGWNQIESTHNRTPLLSSLADTIFCPSGLKCAEFTRSL